MNIYVHFTSNNIHKSFKAETQGFKAECICIPTFPISFFNLYWLSWTQSYKEKKRFLTVLTSLNIMAINWNSCWWSWTLSYKDRKAVILLETLRKMTLVVTLLEINVLNGHWLQCAVLERPLTLSLKFTFKIVFNPILRPFSN